MTVTGVGYDKYHCQYCGAVSSNPENLKKHIWEVHDNAKPYTANDISPLIGVAATLAEREKTYGNFAQEAVLVEALKKTLRSHPKWELLPDDAKLSLEMISLKQVRAINCFTHIDNWHDISGYAKLVEDRLNE